MLFTAVYSLWFLALIVIAADVCIIPVRLLKRLSVFLEDESRGCKNLACHVVRR